MSDSPYRIPAGRLPSEQRTIRRKCVRYRAVRVPFPEDAVAQSIPERFEQVVEIFPQRTAVKSPTGELTYEALSRQANAVAQLLLELGAKDAETIGLLFQHGVHSTVAALGVLKSGAVRVELDVSYPQARLLQIIGLCQPDILLTDSRHLALSRQLASPNMTIVNLDELPCGGCETAPAVTLLPDMPTLISYTSGSTGEPKGIVKDHGHEMHSVMRVTNSICLDAEDRLIFTRLGGTMCFMALLNGATYYPADLAHDPDLHGLAAWLRDEKITVFRSAVSTFRALTRTLGDARSFPELRMVVLQGEPVYRSDVEAYRRCFGDDCILVSTLGVSELGDCFHYFIDKASPDSGATIPGGYPLLGTDICLLDDAGRFLPGNAQGEIGVRGPYIGVNALRRPDLTRKLFCGQGQTLTYRTGDIGCVSSDGCVMHHGRRDFQVKVRGHRIDLGELEAALHGLDGVAQAAAKGHMDKYGDVNLVAYVVAEDSDPRPTEVMRRHLRMVLPEYMIPAVFVQMDTLPLTLTGKVDRRLLPEPDGTRPELETFFREPQGAVQKHVATIWREVLGIDRIGIDDRFLDVGGDSLKATMILARVIDAFAVDVAHRSVFETLLGAGTIRQMAATMAGYSPKDSSRPALRAQRRPWGNGGSGSGEGD